MSLPVSDAGEGTATGAEMKKWFAILENMDTRETSGTDKGNKKKSKLSAKERTVLEEPKHETSKK